MVKHCRQNFLFNTFLTKEKGYLYNTIKALSNEKFHDLQKKYPDISLSFNSDKFNPEADVIIMTTEIL